MPISRAGRRRRRAVDPRAVVVSLVRSTAVLRPRTGAHGQIIVDMLGRDRLLRNVGAGADRSIRSGPADAAARREPERTAGAWRAHGLFRRHAQEGVAAGIADLAHPERAVVGRSLLRARQL